MNGARWKWIGSLVAGAVMALISVASFYGGVQRGHDEAVTRAAVDAKRLADVEVKAQAASDRMGERITVDAVQDAKIAELERQHQQVIERMDKLIDVLWDMRRSDRARKPGE